MIEDKPNEVIASFIGKCFVWAVKGLMLGAGFALGFVGICEMMGFYFA